MPRAGIMFRLTRAVIPDQAIPFSAQRGRHADRVPINDLALVIPLVVDVPPLDLTLGQQVPEDAVLGSSPGQHGEKPALALMDIGHVLGAGQLAVGHVEEIASSGQATEQVPGSAVGLVVDHVAAGDLEIQGNRTVLGHREDVKQLLEVGPMIFVVAPGDAPSSSLGPAFLPQPRQHKHHGR